MMPGYFGSVQREQITFCSIFMVCNVNPDELAKGLKLQYVGGGFLFGMALSALKFWRYIRGNLEIREKSVGFAILNYSALDHSNRFNRTD